MTPAALSALAKGDMKNFAAAATPGGIEAQEKAGQIEQSFAETLPIDGTASDRRPWESLGFVFGMPADDIFVNVTFPKGWRKSPTDHSMWSDILDDQGRKRGGIFYKAAFYDRNAHCHLETRFHIRNDYASPESTISITDVCGKVDRKLTGFLKPDWSDRVESELRHQNMEQATKDLGAWMDENYPDWRSPLGHWE